MGGLTGYDPTCVPWGSGTIDHKDALEDWLDNWFELPYPGLDPTKGENPDGSWDCTLNGVLVYLHLTEYEGGDPTDGQVWGKALGEDYISLVTWYFEDNVIQTPDGVAAFIALIQHELLHATHFRLMLEHCAGLPSSVQADCFDAISCHFADDNLDEDGTSPCFEAWAHGTNALLLCMTACSFPPTSWEREEFQQQADASADAAGKAWAGCQTVTAPVQEGGKGCGPLPMFAPQFDPPPPGWAHDPNWQPPIEMCCCAEDGGVEECEDEEG